ncbi:hypothetical protein O7606_24730 [Micromonospora sp. WMMD882]|uniref:hypothetical protein n=1 Tax=Micromonospora sp. WMMD882 TaxID=3015151 RepID=UPI00248CED0A|nr:hypothetical protein [Micromonospora sp. WMMD882]WBB79335.1 hypothetical protein O7606_24730 [Micromonospora sp. WMMD882]
MISNNERIRIRRQMQRRIQDVVAERRRARLMKPTEPAAEAETRPEVEAAVLSNG